MLQVLSISFPRIIATYLSIKNLSSLDWVGGAAKDEPRSHIAFLDTFHLNETNCSENHAFGNCARHKTLQLVKVVHVHD